MPLYLAIDLGTTGCRSILYDAKLREVGNSYREYGLFTPREKWAEQDANLWWALTLETAKEAIAASGLPAAEIRGVSVSSQGITVVPVDADFRPLCNALSWLDVRAGEQAASLERAFGTRDMFTLTGKRIHEAYTLPKVLWLRENCPGIYDAAHKLLMPMDFLLARLTGRCATDHTMASGTLMYDIRNAKWSDRVLEGVGVPLEKLPALLWSGEAVGAVLPEVARELGLREDCVVAVGAQDQRCASLGAGLGEGVMTISLGTAAAVCRTWDRPHTEGDTRIGWSAYVRPGAWVTEGVINTAAASMRWLRNEMFPGMSYAAIDQEARRALEAGGGLLFYPYLNGPSSPDFYPDSQGCFLGANLATRRGDFALAVMEGVAFQIRILLEAMRSAGSVHAISLFGGGANSDLWCQIIADATGLDIAVPETAEVASVGAAMLAGIGAGEFSWDALPEVGTRKRYRPGSARARYARLYERYREAEFRLWRE
ncbi:MAG: hypothetical protein GX647_12055 [Clostridiales bacterium]|nr:hypothetical protein [Clostridiales bacterium]